jgi:hypothetical protein
MDWVSNGCTGVFDGNWIECCKRHDICYSDKGNTYVGRLDCDWELFRCIASQSPAHWPVAVVYFLGVQAFGAFVSTAEPIRPIGPPSTFIPPPADPDETGPTKRCSYVIRVMAITRRLRGWDSKTNWRFEFGTDPQNVQVTTPDITLTPYGPRYDLNGGQGVQIYNSAQHTADPWCGAIVVHQLWINALDTPVGKEFFLAIRCLTRKPNVPVPYIVTLDIDDNATFFNKGSTQFTFELEVESRCHG